MDRASRSLIIQMVLIIFQNSRRLPGVLANHRLPVLLLDLRVSGETKTRDLWCHPFHRGQSLEITVYT